MSYSVLLVEDEPDIRRIGVLALSVIGGCTVVEASSGFEALEAAETLFPDVVLMDVMMPGMDGVACAARLRALPGHADTPVIFVTAAVQENERARYMASGALGIIKKPFDSMTLAKDVADLLGRQL